MAFSLSKFLYAALATLLVSRSSVVRADTVTYDWDIEWTRANPDGLQERSVIGINGQWPCPLLNITKGDRVVVNVVNKLGNESTSIHFHGLYQNGTNSMDGPVGATQCEIPPGGKFTYDFTIDQPGTYWYHSHVRAQYPDGIRGQLLVHDPENPYNGQFDEELPLTLSDWYHDEMPGLIAGFISVTNPTGAEPVPKSALMNDTQNLTISVQPDKTYFLRITNIGAFAGQYFWIEGHTLKIVEVDGIYTEPAEADMIYLTAAQRYGVLVTTKSDTSANFPIMGSMDTDLFDTLPADLNYNVTGWLVYDDTAQKPTAAEIDEFDPFDDFTLVPQDGEMLLGDVDYSFNLDMKMDNLGDGANYAFFNDKTYVVPKVPTLYTALTSQDQATNVAVYGSDTNAFVLEKGEVVEIVLNNDDAGKHPFHLHGHAFQAVVRSDENAGFYDSNNHSAFPTSPMRRDTFMVKPQSNIVIRFRADNPGVWLFHCHIEWHIASGLVATMIEAPLELQKTLTIPEDHFQACRDSNTPYQGNAAGNTADLLDLRGENRSPAPLPAGFTARGIVALVFSCVSAFVGMGFIAWYGAAPLVAS
ncbi:multicopper oxidase [Polychaeton citri CBS 116435]|uniref:Multicopper oxidase n=1 Tax=Polychaeton citri CBS 116435 TaxID=1314669 RepID=A0A9P4UV08_9PEZI|nr:multicopper oxidase [Polychaeton citri CBS 116435]